MSPHPLGWDYPAGAENDPKAPYNQPDAPEPKACTGCGYMDDEDTPPEESSLCKDCGDCEDCCWENHGGEPHKPGEA